MSTAYTFYFNEIIPDYDTWKQVIEQCDIVNYANAEEASFDKYCYKLISREYSNCNIRYFEPEAFVLELCNVYENKFKQFLKEKKIIDSMFEVTEKEMIEVEKTLANMANNPNFEPQDPTQPLNYISAQTYSQVTSNKLKAYFEALNNIPSLNTFKFLKESEGQDMAFSDLFMNVQPIQYGIYEKGE